MQLIDPAPLTPPITTSLQLPTMSVLVAFIFCASTSWLTIVPVLMIDDDDMLMMCALDEMIFEAVRVGIIALDATVNVSTSNPPVTCMITEDGTAMVFALTPSFPWIHVLLVSMVVP